MKEPWPNFASEYRQILNEDLVWLDTSNDLRHRLRRGVRPYEGDEAAVPITLSLSDSRASAAGSVIIDVDRELRRATGMIVDHQVQEATRQGKLLRPRQPDSVSLTSAEPGSLHIVMFLLGEAANALLSRPVQLAITVNWLLERRRRWSAKRAPRRDVHQIAQVIGQSADAAIAAGYAVDFHIQTGPGGDVVAEFRSVPQSPSN